MARIKYYYDTETCKYERVRVSPWDMFVNTLGFVLSSVAFAGVIVWVLSTYFESPKEYYQSKELEKMALYYDLLNKEIDQMRKVAKSLQERDENVYRVIFEAEPVPLSFRPSWAMNPVKYKQILDGDLDSEELIAHTVGRIHSLQKEMYIQTKSYDEILRLARDKSKMLASIPAIQPVVNKELTKLVSGFGLRIHPIYKVKKMHTGCDFSAPKGTPIYATGDGRISLLKKNKGGYGNEIEIDHGYGYVTKYAHMDSFAVKPGQVVKRGELIGYVGNTGSSTAPHLHYEVIHNGKKVNPVHYFYNDLDPMEYETILELAERENQSLS